MKAFLIILLAYNICLKHDSARAYIRQALYPGIGEFTH